jgi:membrane fusion protein (multidrug efflux system)
MFVDVEVILPARAKVLTIPATAVLYAPYSDSVFIVEEKAAATGGTPEKYLRQQFVRLGATQGDFVTVLDGLQAGLSVVSTGVFKLRNGQKVVVDNALAPRFNLQPRPDDS